MKTLPFEERKIKIDYGSLSKSSKMQITEKKKQTEVLASVEHIDNFRSVFAASLDKTAKVCSFNEAVTARITAENSMCLRECHPNINRNLPFSVYPFRLLCNNLVSKGAA